jgi:hypothetical protein
MSSSLLRGQTATATAVTSAGTDLESRPSTREHKKLGGILKRWATRRFSSHSRVGSLPSNESHHRQQQQHQNHNHRSSNNAAMIAPTGQLVVFRSLSATTSSSTTAASTESSSFSFSSAIPLRRNIHSHSKLGLIRRNPTHHRPTMTVVDTSKATTPSPMHVMSWLETECPHAVVPLILSYAGPRITSTLGRTNRFWYGITQEESTWRVMCEELYKVRLGRSRSDKQSLDSISASVVIKPKK